MIGGLPITEQEMRDKLRQEFNKNKDVTDLRIIDMLIFHVSSTFFFLVTIIIPFRCCLTLDLYFRVETI